VSAPVLVTGATGFLGSHLLALLRGRRPVRVLTRATTPELEATGAEIVEGSLLDPDALRKSLRGVRRVYHAAGLVSRDPRAAAEMYRVHVEGTRELLLAARAEGVSRVLLVSTSGTVAVSEKEETSDETAPYRLETVRNWPYYLSKIYQEKLALQMAEEGGPEVVVVNPSLLLGPGDLRGSSTGDVLAFLRGEVPFVPSGGISFVDARDAAAGAILAMERGRPSRRYLLAAANWPMETFFARLARVAGMRPPLLRVPDPMAQMGARLLRLLPRARLPDPVSVEMSRHFWYADASRARAELSWEPRDPMETLEDTVADLRARHFGAAPPRLREGGHLEALVAQVLEAAEPEPLAPAASTAKPRRRR